MAAMNDEPGPRLFALSESRDLGVAIGHAAGLELAPLEERAFEEGEFKLRPLVSVRDRDVFVVQTLAGTPEVPVAQRFVRLLFLVFGLRDAGARRITAVVPYLAYARKDRRTQPRDPVTTRYVAQLLETTSLDRLLCLDVHNPAALDNAFRIHVDHFSATTLFVNHFAQRYASADVAVASPDVGGIKRVQVFRELLQAELQREVPILFIEKRRASGVVSGGTVVGEATGRTVIVLDDLCASGGTLIRAATALREAGALEVHAAFTHAPLPRGLAALEAAEAISGIVLTDSVGSALVGGAREKSPKATVLSVAPLFGSAIARMCAGIPITPLFQRGPPRDV
ncbi:MAG TPA: ribose-phosphate diphosphokinase [Steroidobacteraceae bacterium]|nr:ribose-phosphate diphosphokinase [Steroidobacteraceae bacterium]